MKLASPTSISMEPNQQKRNTLSLVQVCRGVAACMVACYHTGTLYAINLNILVYNNIFKFGHCGVEFFFVLSGFIIYYIHNADIGRPDRLFPFIQKRFLRIYPVWWIVFMINLLKKPLSFSLFVASLTLWPVKKPYFSVAWTLSYEMFFYLLFGLLIITFYNRITKSILALYTAILITYMFVSVYDNSLEDSFVLSFLLNRHILNFGLGVFGGYVVTSRKYTMYRKPLLFTGIFLFAISAILSVMEVNRIALGENVSAYIQAEGIFSIFEKLSPVFYGIPSLMILVGAAFVDIYDKPNVWKLPIFLGSASFSIYLIHAPILNIVTLQLQKVDSTLQHYMILPTLLISVFVGCCFYLIVEKPLTTLLSKPRMLAKQKAIPNP